MGDNFKKVQAGQSLEISASVWNALLDVSQQAKRSQHDQADSSQPVTRHSNFALVRNQTGYDLGRFAVVELGTPIITPTDNELEFKNRTSFSGLLPSITTGPRFGVTLEPIAIGAIGTATVAGIVPVRVAVGADVYACAEPMPGTSILQCVPHGPATLLWIEPAGVIRWANGTHIFELIGNRCQTCGNYGCKLSPGGIVLGTATITGYGEAVAGNPIDLTLPDRCYASGTPMTATWDVELGVGAGAAGMLAGVAGLDCTNGKNIIPMYRIVRRNGVSIAGATWKAFDATYTSAGTPSDACGTRVNGGSQSPSDPFTGGCNIKVYNWYSLLRDWEAIKYLFAYMGHWETSFTTVGWP